MRGKFLRNHKLQCIIIFAVCMVVVLLGNLIAKADNTNIKVDYRTYISEGIMLEWATDGKASYKDNNVILTGIRINIAISDREIASQSYQKSDASIRYSVYSKEAGWSKVAYNGEKTTSLDNPFKAIKVEISGDAINDCNIEYRVLNSINEWSNWCLSGEVAGNVYVDENIIGFQAKIVKENVSTDKNTANSSTGQAEKILSIAASQLGNSEAADGWTKYGQWYQDNIDGSSYFANKDWCAMFVSWCANEAGVSRDILTPYAYCGYGIQYFKEKGDWHDRSSGYVPKRGDVIFFGTDRHTGLVDYSENGVVYTIEGNSTNDSVARKSYDLGYGDINGYGSPKYQ